MSVFRVITRIIPLSSPESTFEPASIDQLTDGNVGDIKVLDLTEPQSGMKYRIERISYVQNVGPGESVESVNKAYAEKLKTIPGFVQFKSDDLPLNPYDKSFQITLPKVLFGQSPGESSTSNSQQEKRSDSFKISVVKNFNFKKGPNSRPKKPIKGQTAISNECSDGVDNDAKLKTSKVQTESKSPLKHKYLASLRKKWFSGFRNKRALKSWQNKKWSKSEKSLNSYIGELSSGGISQKKQKGHTAGYIKRKIDNSKTFTVGKSVKDGDVLKRHSSAAGNQTKKANGNIYSNDEDEEEEGDYSDEDGFLELESGDLIINVPEVDLNSTENRGDTSDPSPLLKSALTITKVKKNNISDDSFLGDSPTLNKFIIPDGHPAKELLLALKKYFVNDECLICGFIPTDEGFNGFEHMRLHTLSNSFTSSYKCSCCDEKFSNPRNLYMHALSREKSYKYMCNVCLLKFKRKHYLSRHAAKSH